MRGMAALTGQPNFLILWVDDLGYGDLGCFGNNTLLTPNIDALAATGIKLTQHLVASPICTPSRAALLTSRHAVRSGMTSNGDNTQVMGLGPGGLRLDEITVAELLQGAGYSTGMVGKWHLGLGANGSRLPMQHGFDYYWGMPITNVQACKAGGKNEYSQPTLLQFLVTRSPVNKILTSLIAVALIPNVISAVQGKGIWTCGLFSRLLFALIVAFLLLAHWYTATFTLINPRACLLYEGQRVIEQPVQLNYLTHRHTQKAKQFIDRAAAAKKPWFLYLSYTKVHTALFTTDAFKGVSQHHGEFGDNVAELDWSVGQVLDHVRSLNMSDDTFVYFGSDNGPFREERDEGGSCGFPPVLSATGVRQLSVSNKKLKGAKGQTWECGIRVPGIVSFPKKYKGGTSVHVATSAMDVMPTMLSLTGIGGKVRHVSSLAEGEKAGPGVIDGRDMGPLLSLYDDVGDDSEKAKFTHHASMVHYCGAKVAAVRYGAYKAHYTTAKWENSRADNANDQFCVDNVICDCHGHTHDPPLLYDIHSDPSESDPLDPSTSANLAVLAKIEKVKVRHEASILAVPSETAVMASKLQHLPCCNQQPGTLAYSWRVTTNQCGC